jgi:outer membrane protein TolC
MNIPLMGKCLLSCWLLFAAFTAHGGQPLTLAEAIRLGSESQPLLQSLDDAAAASREAAVAEAQLPDPRLRLGILNLPASGSDAGRFNRDDMTMSTIGVMQEVTPQAKREAASRQMEAVAGQYHAEQLAMVRAIERDIALAWLDVFENQRKTELYTRIAHEMAAERKVLNARISSGGSQPIDALRLETQLSMVNDKTLLARGNEQKARAMLARWIGSAAQRALPPELPFQTDAAGLIAPEAALENHPLVQTAKQIENVASSDADRARAERQLNWSWEVMYGKRRSDLSDMVSFQVAIDLPWDRANRQDRRTAEKLVLVEKARKLTEDRRRELAAELESARAEWEIAGMRDAEHQARLIPAAQAQLSVAQAGYAAGRQSLAEVWEARRGLIEVELEHWAILVDQQRAAVRLAYLLDDRRFFSGSQP